MTTVAEIFGLSAPKVFKLKKSEDRGCANPDLLMGMELEIENCADSSDEYIPMLNPLGWVVTTDNSLRGINTTTNGNVGVEGWAYEFISKPMRAEDLMVALDNFFTKTKFNEKNYSDRCSVHVHVNCQNLTIDQVSCIALLYSVVEDIMFQFVGNDRENNIYCVPWNQSRMNYDMVAHISANADSTIRRWMKYTALNLVPLRSHGTVEFRHMEGTCDIKKLHTWINIIGSMFKYGCGLQLTELITEIKSLNSTSEYETFFNRVFGNTLSYSDKYRVSMENGVILAKYSLLSLGRKKQAKVAMPIMDDIEMGPADPAPTIEERIEHHIDRHQLTEALEEVGRNLAEIAARNPAAQRPHRTVEWGPGAVPPAEVGNRFDPWPAPGTTVRVGRSLLNQREVATLSSRTGEWRWGSPTEDRSIRILPPTRAPAAHRAIEQAEF